MSAIGVTKIMREYLAFLKGILCQSKHFDWRYNLGLLWAWVISFRLNKSSMEVAFGYNKNSAVLRWLRKKYDYLIPGRLSFEGNGRDSNKIWVFWYQGIDEHTPEVVRLCVDSIKKNANCRQMVLLTKDNFTLYYTFPDYVIMGLEGGWISVTHFSDILRLALLYKYGGLWMDATLLVTQPISTEGYNPIFTSIKIPDRHTGTISAYRWTGYYIYSKSGSPAMKTFLAVILKYWEEGHKWLPDYLFIDFTFVMLYDKCKDFRDIVDGSPYSNRSVYELEGNMNRTDMNIDDVLAKYADTTIFKLNWRDAYVNQSGGRPTLFRKFIESYE